LPKQTEVLYPTDSLVASEIAQQPALWLTTLERVLPAGIGDKLDGWPIILTGGGTSTYVAKTIADAWPRARAIPIIELLQQSMSGLEFA
jgi:hypothetical protein